MSACDVTRIQEPHLKGTECVIQLRIQVVQSSLDASLVNEACYPFLPNLCREKRMNGLQRTECAMSSSEPKSVQAGETYSVNFRRASTNDGGASLLWSAI